MFEPGGPTIEFGAFDNPHFNPRIVQIGPGSTELSNISLFKLLRYVVAIELLFILT